MLFFYAAPATLDLPATRRHGLSGAGGTNLHLHAALADAEAATDGPVLVVDATALSTPLPAPDADVRVASVPPDALQNVDPYRPPAPVTAAGGYVGCPLPNDVALLLIHRYGVWDLPKGTCEPGEAVDACAAREVREEVGIQQLDVLRALGPTQHGYSTGDTYAVKTTHWFLMQTPARTFTPQREEDIRRVAWARWDVARAHMGYETLRRHMDQVKTTVRKSLP